MGAVVSPPVNSSDMIQVHHIGGNCTSLSSPYIQRGLGRKISKGKSFRIVVLFLLWFIWDMLPLKDSGCIPFFLLFFSSHASYP